MAWLGIEGIEDEQANQLRRAVDVKRYAQRVLKLYQEGKWDPVRAARGAGLLEDVLEDSDAFSARQRAELQRLADTLRSYARGLMQAHHRTMHPPQRRRPPRAQPRAQSTPFVPGSLADRPVRQTDVPVSGWEADDPRDELGFLPALLGAAAPLIGSLFGGGQSAPAPAPAAPAPPVIVSGQGGGGAAIPQALSSVSLPAIGGVIADQIRAVPANVRQQVVDALRESLDQFKSGQADAQSLMADIRKQLGPSITKQLDSVNQAALQRQATFEHNMLKDRDARWQANASAQKRILARMDQMERTLGSAMAARVKKSDAVARAFGVPPRLRG